MTYHRKTVQFSQPFVEQTFWILRIRIQLRLARRVIRRVLAVHDNLKIQNKLLRDNLKIIRQYWYNAFSSIQTEEILSDHNNNNNNNNNKSGSKSSPIYGLLALYFSTNREGNKLKIIIHLTHSKIFQQHKLV